MLTCKQPITEKYNSRGVSKMKKIFCLLVFFSFTLYAGNNFRGIIDSESLGEGIWIQRNSSDTSPKKIAIATVIISGKKQDYWDEYKGNAYKDMVAFGTQSKEIYARKHGYDFIIATQKLDDCYGVKPSRDLECAWTKLALISRILDEYEWVFWSDADSVILNFDIKLEDFIDEEYDIIGCAERPTEVTKKPFIPSCRFNTGQMFYKNCEFTKQLIFDAWCNHDQDMPGYEQARINSLLQDPEKASHALIYSEEAFNLTPQRIKEGAFLVHMYGYYRDELRKCFREYEKKYKWLLEKEMRDYEQQN